MEKLVTIKKTDLQKADRLNELVILPKNAIAYGERRLSDIDAVALDKPSKEMALACFGEQRICLIDPNISGELLRIKINKTLFESGMKAEGIDLLILTVIEDIFRDHSDLTISEIQIAFRNGVRGNYGEVMGMSVRTFNYFIREFRKQKAEAIKLLWSKLPHNKEKVYTKEEIEAIRLRHIDYFIDCFASMKKGGGVKILDSGNMFYKYLEDLKILQLTPDEKKTLYEKAKSELMGNTAPDAAFNTFEAVKLKERRKKIEAGDKQMKDEIVRAAKTLCLEFFFFQLISQQKDLSKLISEKDVAYKEYRIKKIKQQAEANAASRNNKAEA